MLLVLEEYLCGEEVYEENIIIMSLQKNSIRTVFIGLALLLGIFGLGLFNEASTQLSLATIVSMFVAAIVLFVELNIKQFTKFSGQKEFSIGQILGLGLVLVLVTFAFYAIPFVNSTPPQFVQNITTFSVGISSLYIIYEAITA